MKPSPNQKLVRVLVVDDHVASANLLETVLSLEGFVARSVYDAVSAYELARCARPDLLLIDVMMPGVNGLDLARWVRQDAQLANTPVVLCSAQPLELPAEARDRCCDAFIPKPVDICQLGSQLRQVLARRQPRKPDSVSPSP